MRAGAAGRASPSRCSAQCTFCRSRTCTLSRSKVTLQSMQVKLRVRQLPRWRTSCGFFRLSPHPSHWNHTIPEDETWRSNSRTRNVSREKRKKFRGPLGLALGPLLFGGALNAHGRRDAARAEPDVRVSLRGHEQTLRSRGVRSNQRNGSCVRAAKRPSGRANTQSKSSVSLCPPQHSLCAETTRCPVTARPHSPQDDSRVRRCCSLCPSPDGSALRRLPAGRAPLRVRGG